MKDLEVKIGKYNVTITCEEMEFEEVLQKMAKGNPPHEEFLKILKNFEGSMSPHIKWEIIKWCLDNQKKWDIKIHGDDNRFKKFKYLEESIREYLDDESVTYCIEYETELDGKFIFHEDFQSEPTLEDIEELIFDETARRYDSDYERLKFYKV